MPRIIATATVPTPGHLATERHPATVTLDGPHHHARVYANYVPKTRTRTPGTVYYCPPRQDKHPHPAPTTGYVPCGRTDGVYGAYSLPPCTESAGHVLVYGTAHYSDGFGWFANASEASDAAIVFGRLHR